MRTIHRKIVSALIFSKDGKLLLGKKDLKAGGVYADCWHIPGGGVDAGETLEQALRREMLEEVGIDVADCKVSQLNYKNAGEAEKMLKGIGEKVWVKMEFNYFRVDVSHPADKIYLQTNDDLIELRWIDPAQVADYKLTPPSIELFKHVRV